MSGNGRCGTAELAATGIQLERINLVDGSCELADRPHQMSFLETAT